MLRRAIPFAISACIALSGGVLADESPTIKDGHPNAAEAKFIATAQADIGKRFATSDAATTAGYVRYTDPDETGAISYANMRWASSDVHHPSQLWYDKHGRLLGADYSILASSTRRPHVWGIAPGRWYAFDAHIHFVVKDPKTGKLAYDKYVMEPKFKAAGGDPAHPNAATLVKLHDANSVADVPVIFDFPAIWDLIVWIKPNPSGAFAGKNPLVKP